MISNAKGNSNLLAWRDVENAPPQDDALRGRLLSRKEALMMLAGGGTVWAGLTRSARAKEESTASPCVVLPEMTEGPFYVDSRLHRSDIRAPEANGTPTPGSLLQLGFRISVIDGGRCVPLPDAVVDVWHCDARGRYSGVRDRSGNTESEMFLRGFQVTDVAGSAHFTTIYPGWYRGRAVHIHFKIRSAVTAEKGYAFASQLFFDDGLSDKVHRGAPYAANGVRDRRNKDDGIYRNGGEQLMLNVCEKSGVFAAVVDVAIDRSRS